MGIFRSIKKSRRASGDIDEKIEYLNKELEKTGLREAMSTSNIYVSGDSVPNEDFNKFNGLGLNGQSLGISGADGNGLGGAIVGTNVNGVQGVALSPPHPVTGQRTWANHILDGIGTGHPLQPGKSVFRGFSTKTLTKMGGALWFFDSNYNFGGQQGRWLNFEWFGGGWGFWDTSFLGFYFHNQNLDQYELNGVNIGTQVKNAIVDINFGNDGELGTPKTLVLTKNNLDDVGFLPINIDGLSTQGFSYLSRESRRDEVRTLRPPTTYVNLGGGAYPLTGRTKTFTSGSGKVTDTKGERRLAGRTEYRTAPGEPNYVDGSSETTTSTQTQQTQQTPPPSSLPSSDFDPNLELTPDNIPNEFRLDDTDADKPVDDSKPTEKGKGIKLKTWMSGADYRDKYPGTSVVDYLNSLPYGPTDFMTPNPNFPGAWDLNREGYQNYFLKGDLSALGNSSGTPEPRHSSATPEPEEKKWGGKTKEELMADLDKTIERLTAEEKAAYAEMRKIALELGMDFVSLIGGLFTGGATAAPVMGKLGMKLLKKYGKTVAGKMLRKLLKKFRNKKNDKLIDDIADAAERGGNDPETPTRKPFGKDQGDTYQNLSRAGEARFDSATEKLINQRRLGGSDGDLAGRFLDDLTRAADVSDTALNNVLNKIKKSAIGYLFNSYKPDGKLLSEASKLGHFEPEQLNVNIEDLRKGIMPEYPKDPPPEMVDGYSSKSRLAPKKLERSSFIKITKKDLAKNHRLKDSEIKDFMDTINAVNDFIKKHPEELIYAQTRYPKNDPRLAQLNWEMDQKLNASKEYMDKHYPENQKLFTKVQKSIKKNIELTDPKSFKGVKVPKFKGVDLTDFKRRKEVVARHYKKAVKVKRLFSRKKT